MLDPDPTSPQPPRQLGEAGTALWRSIQGEYDIWDPGGSEILMQACECADRLAVLSARIETDGIIVETKTGPKPHPLLRDEVSNRSFLTRTLERLGLNLEAIRPRSGRPSGTGWKAKKDRADGDE